MNKKTEHFLRTGLQDLVEGVLRKQLPENISNEDMMSTVFHLVRDSEMAKIRCESVIEHMEDCLFHLDLHGNCLYLSSAWTRMSGNDLEGSVGTPFSEYFDEESKLTLAEAIEEIKTGKSVTFDLKNKNTSTSVIWLGMRAAPMLNDNGDIVGIRGALSDETQRRNTEQRLKLSALAFDATAESIVIATKDEKIVKVNKAFEKITGYKEHEVLGKTPRILSSGIHDEGFFRAMWNGIKNNGSWRGEVWNRKKDGTLYPEILSINALRDQEGHISHFVALAADISSLKDAEKNANLDPITKLPNRTVFFDRLSHAIELASKRGSHVIVICIDLDNFKSVNDSLGHLKGDHIIKETAVRLAKHLEKGETIARIGGDEFVIIMESVKEYSEISTRIERLLQVFRQPYEIDSNEIFVSASMGISMFPEDGETPESLLKNADIAMYKAKEHGRNRFQFYREDMNEGAEQRLRIESRLHRALAENELFMVHQPQINLSTGEVTGTEALIRWKNPKLGLIPPDQFIPVAEKTGLIEGIGHWAFLESCQQVADAKHLPHGFCISVNLSAKQLKNPAMIKDIKDIIDKTGLPPSSVEVELTESVMIDDPECVSKALQEIRALGVGIAIDDFGTGYSSFAYLKKYPPTKLKIDRSFIKDLPESEEDAAIIKAIIAMAHSMNIKVVAEGVETKEQMEFLILAQCDMAQGYYISRPIPLSEVKLVYDMGIF